MATEYTVTVNAITTPPIIGVEVTAGCGGGGSTKEEVFVRPVEPTEDWTDGLWADTSTLVTADGSVDEVVVALTEPPGAWEIFADLSVVSPVVMASDDVTILMAHIRALEIRVAELEQGR